MTTAYEFRTLTRHDDMQEGFTLEKDPKNPRIAIIRTSDRISFKNCRRRWGWSSHLRHNLGPKQNAAPLWFGSGIHFALEDFHGYNKFGNPTTAFMAYVKATKEQNIKALPEETPELIELGQGMLDYYVNVWLRNRNPLKTYWVNEVPQVEVNFRFKIPMDQKLLESYGYDEVFYSGTIDRVCIDEETDSLWLMDYKSAKTIQTLHYMTDPQVSAYCVPESTEIFTRAGWKRHSELVIGEEVLGFNKEADCLEWTTLTAINLPGIQKLNKISAKSFEFYATPDHRWVRGVKSKGIAYKNNSKTRIIVDTLDNYKDNSYIIMSAPLDSEVSNVSVEEAAVLGWLLTDGSWGTSIRGRRASISQKKYVEEIQTLLDTIPGSYTRVVSDGQGSTTWHLSMSFLDVLLSKSGLSFDYSGWENFVTGMSLEVRTAFCNAAMLGDSSPITNTFYQKPGIKHDLFRLAFFLNGGFPTASRIGGKGNPWSEPNANTFNIGTPHKWMKTVNIEASHEESVWCPTTELGTWIMRQGDIIAITGNCWAAPHIYDKPIAGFYYQQHKKEIPKLGRILQKPPGAVSLAANQATDYFMYKQTLIQQYGDDLKTWSNEHKQYLRNLQMLENDDDNPYIRRDKIYRNHAQAEAEGAKIMMEVEDMLNPNLPLYPNQTRDCPSFCPFISPCVSLDSGLDFHEELKVLMRPRAASYDPWRSRIKWPKPEEESFNWDDI